MIDPLPLSPCLSLSLSLPLSLLFLALFIFPSFHFLPISIMNDNAVPIQLNHKAVVFQPL